MKLIIIAALNKRNVIGKNGAIPWNIPEDLQRFKRLTTGHSVLMGRKTFESIGKPLPGRNNIVISRDKRFSPPGVRLFDSLESAFSHLQNEEKVFIIGGGEIFRQTIARADELLLTFVDNDEEGDVFFPQDEKTIVSDFEIANEEIRDRYRFADYKRKKIPG